MTHFFLTSCVMLTDNTFPLILRLVKVVGPATPKFHLQANYILATSTLASNDNFFVSGMATVGLKYEVLLRDPEIYPTIEFNGTTAICVSHWADVYKSSNKQLTIKIETGRNV
jgi:hypothetical protein